MYEWPYVSFLRKPISAIASMGCNSARMGLYFVRVVFLELYRFCESCFWKSIRTYFHTYFPNESWFMFTILSGWPMVWIWCIWVQRNANLYALPNLGNSFPHKSQIKYLLFWDVIHVEWHSIFIRALCDHLQSRNYISHRTAGEKMMRAKSASQFSCFSKTRLYMRWDWQRIEDPMNCLFGGR